MKICGMVVLFHATEKVLQNINTYLPFLERLYIIDNSQEENPLFSHLPKVKYQINHENKGIATALNQGVALAQKDGFTHLLTMDQDSYFQGNDFQKMLQLVEQRQEMDVGIYSPLHQTESTKMNQAIEKETEVVMTSGNLLDLAICQKLGGFKDWLFIDGVDHEYCLHLRKEGYRIKVLKEIVLVHSLGNVQEKVFLGHHFTLTNHSPIRRYFITRNRYYIASLYQDTFPKFCQRERANQRKEILKILLFEKEKIAKLKAILRGKRDFKKNKKGIPRDLKEKLQ